MKRLKTLLRASFCGDWIAENIINGFEADRDIFRDFEPQLYTVWNFGRGLTQAEAGERLGVSERTVRDDTGKNGHLAEFAALLGPDWNEKVPTQAQIGERIGWSRDAVKNHVRLMDSIGTHILDLAKSHQKGRVPDDGTRVTFPFTEGGHRMTEAEAYRWMSETQRTIVFLRVVQGMRWVDIGRRLNLTPYEVTRERRAHGGD